MKIKETPPIVKIAFFTLLTVIAWISFDVYRALTVEPPVEVSEEILKDLDPSLDAGILNQIQNRVYIPDEQIPDINIVPSDSVGTNVNENFVISVIEELPNTQNEVAETATESGEQQ